MLRSAALVPWARGPLEVRPVRHQSYDRLAEVAHEANVWLRGCNHNVLYVLQDTDPSIFPEVDGSWVDMLNNPPPALLAAAPGHARCQMKRAIQVYDPLCHLLSEDEKAGLVTEADTQADPMTSTRPLSTGRPSFPRQTEGAPGSSTHSIRCGRE